MWVSAVCTAWPTDDLGRDLGGTQRRRFPAVMTHEASIIGNRPPMRQCAARGPGEGLFGRLRLIRQQSIQRRLYRINLHGKESAWPANETIPAGMGAGDEEGVPDPRVGLTVCSWRSPRSYRKIEPSADAPRSQPPAYAGTLHVPVLSFSTQYAQAGVQNCRATDGTETSSCGPRQSTSFHACSICSTTGMS